MAFLETKNLIKSFGEGNACVNVLGGISLTVDEGEICTILGQSGSNKPLCSAQRGFDLFQVLGKVFFELFKSLVTYVMLYFTAILIGNALVHTYGYECLGDDLVPLVHIGGNLHALFGQINAAIAVHGDISLLTEGFHGDRNARLGEFKMICNIDAPDIALLFFNHQY